jgi:hypothetical protein
MQQFDYARINGAPKKRIVREMLDGDFEDDQFEPLQVSKKRHFTNAEQDSFRGPGGENDEDGDLPSNQLGMYPLDYNTSEAHGGAATESTAPPFFENDGQGGTQMHDQPHPPNFLENDGQGLTQNHGSQPQTVNSSPSLLDEKNCPPTGKVVFERIKEDTIEMGGFVLPGSEKKEVLKSYNWIAGRADGQYRVVLGNNTLFKPKNPVDSKTGEKDSNRWRVVRFENRYKENYPYTEFPAKYIETLINALIKAKEQYDREMEEETATN